MDPKDVCLCHAAMFDLAVQMLVHENISAGLVTLICVSEFFVKLHPVFIFTLRAKLML
jgi:hypothetical protein